MNYNFFCQFENVQKKFKNHWLVKRMRANKENVCIFKNVREFKKYLKIKKLFMDSINVHDLKKS